jgi:hypothetical protein
MTDVNLNSPAGIVRDEVMASFLGKAYEVKENITEIWSDKASGALCLRINKICYDVVLVNKTEKADPKFIVLKEGMSAKPSALCSVLGRVVEGENGKDVCKFDWEKLSEDIKTPSQRTLMTGDYRSADGLFQIKWDEDLVLVISSMAVEGEHVFVKATHGALNAEYSKVLKSAVDAYILRCIRKIPNRGSPARKKMPQPKTNNCWTCRKFKTSGTRFPGTCKLNVHLPERTLTGHQADIGCYDHEPFNIESLLLSRHK